MAQVRVKICGITNGDDAMSAAYAGASALGFVFHKKSPRYISPAKASKIIKELPPFVTPVGVFVNYKEGAIRDILRHCGIRTLQLHGDEDPNLCQRLGKNFQVIKAFRIREQFDVKSISKYQTNAYLFDAYQEDVFGGTGKVFNWDLLKGYKILKPVILSGGLNVDNVIEAITALNPYAVDVSSGIEEAPGKKSIPVMKEFIRKVIGYGSSSL